MKKITSVVRYALVSLFSFLFISSTAFAAGQQEKDENGLSPSFWYKFNGNLDWSGARDLGLSGIGSSYTTGKDGEANTAITITSGKTVNQSSGYTPQSSLSGNGAKPTGFTISVIAKIAANGQNKVVLSEFSKKGNNDDIILAGDPINKKILVCKDATTLIEQSIDDITTAFHTYVVTGDGSKVTLYVDGVANSTTSTTYPNTSRTACGIFGDGGGGYQSGFAAAVGTIVDDFRVYCSTCLTAVQVAKIGKAVKSYDVAMSGETVKVSEINARSELASASENDVVNLTLTGTTRFVFDAAFKCGLCNVTLDGDLLLDSETEPDDFAKFDFTGVTGSIVYKWLIKDLPVGTGMAINFNQTKGKLGDSDEAGIPGLTIYGNVWNNTDGGSGSLAAAKMFAPDGETVIEDTMSVSWTGNLYQWTDATTGFLKGYLDDSNITFSTIVPFDRYDVYIICATDTGNAQFSYKKINGVNYSADANGEAIANSTAAWGASHQLTPILGKNVMHLEGLTAQNFAITESRKVSNSVRGCIAAIVIVKTKVPVTKDVNGGDSYAISTANTLEADVVNLTLNAGATLTMDAVPNCKINVIDTGAVTIAQDAAFASVDEAMAKLNTAKVDGSVKYVFVNSTVPANAPTAGITYCWEGEATLATIPFAGVAHAGTIEIDCPVIAVDGDDQDASMSGAKGLVVFDKGFSLTTGERVSLGGSSGANQSYVQNGGKFELTSDAVPGGCGMTPIVLARWPVTVNYDLKAGQLLAENGTVQNWDGSFNLTVGDADGTEAAIFKAKGFAINRGGNSSFTILKNGTLAIGANGINTGANQFFKLNGGTLDAYAAINYTFGSSIQVLSASTINVTDEATLSVTGAFTGEGALTKTGDGALKITGDAANFTGSIAHDVGGLVVSSAMAAEITVADGLTLSIIVTDEQKGTGYTASNVTLDGDNSLVEFIDAGGNVVQAAAHTTELAPMAIKWTAAEAGDWDDANNWSASRVPTAGDIVVFDTPATVTLSASSVASLVAIESEDVVFTGTTASRAIKGTTIAADADLTINSDSNFYLSNVKDGKITKTGAGTLFFVNEANSALNGTTVDIQAGKVELSNDNDDAITTNPTFIIGEDGALDNYGWLKINGTLTITTDYNKTILTNRGANNANIRGGTSFVKNGTGEVTIPCGGADNVNFNSVAVNGGALDITKATTLTGTISGSGIFSIYGLPTGAAQTSLQNPELWTGTIWIKNIASTPAGGLKFNTYGNENSVVRLTNVKGWQATDYNQGAVELVDGPNGELALEVTDSSQNRGYTYTKLTGDGSLKFATKAGSACAMYIQDVSEFTGKLLSTAGMHENKTNATNPRPIYVGTTSGDKTTSSLISVADGVTIISGCGWEAANVAFGATVNIKGAVGDTVISGITTEPTTLPTVTLIDDDGEPIEGDYTLNFEDGALIVAEVKDDVEVAIPEIAGTTVEIWVTGSEEAIKPVEGKVNVPYGADMTVLYIVEEGKLFKNGDYMLPLEYTNVTVDPNVANDITDDDVTVDAGAKLGDVYYLTITDALDDATTGDVVTVLQNATLASLTVPADVTLDLNNKTVVAAAIENNGTIIVYDEATVLALIDTHGTIKFGQLVMLSMGYMFPEGTIVTVRKVQGVPGATRSVITVPEKGILINLVGAAAKKDITVQFENPTNSALLLAGAIERGSHDYDTQLNVGGYTIVGAPLIIGMDGEGMDYATYPNNKAIFMTTYLQFDDDMVSKMVGQQVYGCIQLIPEVGVLKTATNLSSVIGTRLLTVDGAEIKDDFDGTIHTYTAEWIYPEAKVEELIPAPEDFDVAFQYTAMNDAPHYDTAVASFVITPTTAVPADTIKIGGKFSTMGWNTFNLPAIGADESYTIVEAQWSQVKAISPFTCGAASIALEKDTELTLTLKLGDDVIDTQTITLKAVDKLPTAEVNEITAEGYEAAVEFTADKIGNGYENWTAEFVLTSDVAIGSDEIKLGGQYDAYLTEWIDIDFPGCTAGEEINVLGLVGYDDITVQTVFDVIKSFKCGVKNIALKNDATFTLKFVITDGETTKEICSIDGLTVEAKITPVKPGEDIKVPEDVDPEDFATFVNENLEKYLIVPEAAEDKAAYRSLFAAKVIDGTKVAIMLTDTAKADIAKELEASAGEILTPNEEGKATITAKPGLYYGIKATAEVLSIGAAEGQNWVQATGTTVEVKVPVLDSNKAFFKSVCTPNNPNK